MSSSNEIYTLSEHLDRYRGVTLQILELVPDAKLRWQPASQLRSFAEHFLHLARTEDYYIRGFFNNDWEIERIKVKMESASHKIIEKELMDTRALTMEMINRIDGPQLDAIVSVPNAPVRWSLRSWLWFILEHEIHHKAQLSLYLRQIGITPPFFAYVFPMGERPDIS